MQRLASFDVSRQFLTPRGKLAAQLGFGLFCGAAMVGLRSLIDIWAPTSGPFALIYPTVLLATLYGHWRAGLVALATSFLWAWFFVLPAPKSFFFIDPTDPARVALNAGCALILVVFAEGFRRAAHLTMAEIRERADRRLTLLAELEHRTKNNFALVASMLEIQKRRVSDPEVAGPLQDAVGRIRTFADAYAALAMEQADSANVAMAPYIENVLDSLARAALPDNIRLFREIEAIELPRETAVAIALYLNEAIANAMKYGFPDGRPGTIAVYFHAHGDAWTLTIEDDGVGVDAVPDPTGGLGRNLLAAFAAQARARQESGPILKGYRAEMSTVKVEVA